MARDEDSDDCSGTVVMVLRAKPGGGPHGQ